MSSLCAAGKLFKLFLVDSSFIGVEKLVCNRNMLCNRLFAFFVPQGSLMGPLSLLFRVYCVSLSAKIQRSRYARLVLW